jgi:hypothetical protein
MFLRRDLVRVLRGVLDLLLRGLFLGDLVGGRHFGQTIYRIVKRATSSRFRNVVNATSFMERELRGPGTSSFVYFGGWGEVWSIGWYDIIAERNQQVSGERVKGLGRIALSGE